MTSILEKLPKSLTTVTTLSKLLAMSLFVILPFVGFFIGMQYMANITPGFESIELDSNSSKNTPNVTTKYAEVSPTIQVESGAKQVATPGSPKFTNEAEKKTDVFVSDMLDTGGWRDVAFDNISFSVPNEAKVEVSNFPETCTMEPEHCYIIKNHDPNIFQNMNIRISTKKYMGGSRRAEAGLVGNVKYRDVKYGSISALEAIPVCEIDECMTMRLVIFVANDKLVVVQDAYYKYAPDQSVSLESPVTNTIISTVR